MLAESINNRDANNNGLADEGAGWSTFDVSNALKDSKDNVYLGIKTWAAYKALVELLGQNVKKPFAYKTEKEIDIDGNTSKATERAFAAYAPSSNERLLKRQIQNLNEWGNKIESSLTARYKKTGAFPLTLDSTDKAGSNLCTALADGLYYTSLHSSKPDAFSQVVINYSVKAASALRESYGIRLEASSPVTWFSKIIALDGIARMQGKQIPDAYAYAYEWNVDNDQAYQDGAESKTVAWPGNWYPRAANCWQYWLFNFPKKPATYLYVDILKACE